MYFQLNFRFEPYIQKQLGSPFTKNASDPQPETNENLEPCQLTLSTCQIFHYRLENPTQWVLMNKIQQKVESPETTNAL